MRKYTFALIFSMLVFQSQGQESLSLKKAVSLGLARNYDIKIEEKNVNIARRDNTWWATGVHPSLSIGANQNNNSQDNVKVAFPTATTGIIRTSSITPNASLNWTLSNGIVVGIAKDRLERLQDETQGNAEIVIDNTLQAIVLAYFISVLEQDRLTQFEAQLELSKDKYRLQKVRFDIGNSGSSELLLEQGNYLTDSINFINQNTTYKNSVRNLNFLIGEKNVDKDYSFIDGLSQDFDLLTEIQLLQSINNNRDIKRLYITQTILALNTRIAKADRLPTLNLNAGVNEVRQNLNLSNANFFAGDPNIGDNGFVSGPPDPLSSITDTWFANFTLSFNLFDGGRVKRAIRNSIVREDIGNLQIDKMKFSIERDLKNAFRIYNDRKVLLSVNEQREQIAKKNLEINEERFKAGTLNSLDYRAIQNTYLSASIQRLQALYNLIDSKVTILRLTGGLMKEYGS